MPSSLRRLALVILVAAFAFGAGALVATLRGWGSPAVDIEVRNVTGRQIRTLLLDHDSCGGHGTLTAGPVPAAGTHRFRLLVCGEAGYRLRAVLDDGTALERPAGYLENGYRVTETLTLDGGRTDAHR